MSFIRAIPTILWVMVFSVVANVGVEAAIIGMTFHSVAYLVKAYSESIEEIDNGIVEALRATGASFWKIIFQAVLPSTVTSLLSWTFIRFEINFTNAVLVGAAAGAGGIGYDMLANVHARTKTGRTLLHQAAMVRSYDDLLRLLDLGVDPRAVNEAGDTFQRYFFMGPRNPETEKKVRAWLSAHGIAVEDQM